MVCEKVREAGEEDDGGLRLGQGAPGPQGLGGVVHGAGRTGAGHAGAHRVTRTPDTPVKGVLVGRQLLAPPGAVDAESVERRPAGPYAADFPLGVQRLLHLLPGLQNVGICKKESESESAEVLEMRQQMRRMRRGNILGLAERATHPCTRRSVRLRTVSASPAPCSPARSTDIFAPRLGTRSCTAGPASSR